MKNIVKTARLTVLVMIISAACAAQDSVYHVIEGTTAPKDFSAGRGGGNCFIFPNYLVRTRSSDDGGSNVNVFAWDPSLAGEKEPCETKRKPVLMVANADNNDFFGISGNYVFIDTGTSVESRGLEIYDLSANNAKTVFEYHGDPKLTEGRYLSFDSPSVKAGPIKSCKQAAEWKRQGGGVGWVQSERVDLQTMKKTSVGPLRCVYQQ
jgi:hypothetical protein